MTNLHSNRILAISLLLASAVCLLPQAQAQQTTEQFIPIGKSPGISYKQSYMGKVGAVDKTARTFQMESDEGDSKTISLSPSTRIWLDRSKAGKANTTGSFDDLKTGVSVEVMHTGSDKNQADWIKIEAS